MRLQLREFDDKLPCRPELVHKVPDVQSRLLRSPDTQDCGPIDDDIPMIECIPSASMRG